MMDIFITGIGWVLKASMGYRGNINALDAERGLPVIAGKDILGQSHKSFGRMDHFSKIGVAAIVFAMRDANAHSFPNEKTAIIASTCTGCIETDIRYQATIDHENNILPSPALFAYTLPSCFLGEASILYGMTGESFIINEDDSAGITGLSMAVDLLASGLADMALCGINNADTTNIDGHLDPIEPGAIFFLLEKNERAGNGSYGRLVRRHSDNAFYYKGSKIDRLYELAQKCTDGKL